MRDFGRLLFLFLLLTSIAALGPTLADTIGDDDPTPDELSPLPDRDLDTIPDLPAPIPLPVTPADTDVLEVQLVGFTQEVMPANKGVLNYTLACQRVFPYSRMCTVDDINRTVRVPQANGYGHAWVRVDSRTPVMLRAPDGEPMLDPNPAVEATDCDGWTSPSSAVFGTVMDIGEEDGCYGGFHAETCDQALVVACCALVPVVGE